MNPKINILLIAAVLSVPFYFINRYLMRKVKPRESGKNLLIYFGLIVLSIFIYITACIYIVVGVAKIINKT